MCVIYFMPIPLAKAITEYCREFDLDYDSVNCLKYINICYPEFCATAKGKLVLLTYFDYCCEFEEEQND